jgi:hypothetical protein
MPILHLIVSILPRVSEQRVSAGIPGRGQV